MPPTSKRGTSYHERRLNTRPPFPRILIVCEGEKTEPNYFEAFKVACRANAVIKIEGTGRSTVKVVEEAIKLKNEDEFDEVWCVFDRDDNTLLEFNNALKLAERLKIKIAYSNQAFELWYLLHFHYYNAGMTRKNYCTKLDSLLGLTYQKNSSTMYEKLKDKQEQAIKNAEKLLEAYDPPSPVNDDPSTTVHLLIKKLREFIR